MPRLQDLHRWLTARLGPDAAMRGDPDLTVSRLALALEPGDMPASLAADALWLHRSFRAGERFAGWPLLSSHDGFDAALTTGENRPLAQALGWRDVRPLTLERASGLLATPPQTGWSALLAALDTEFGEHEALLEPRGPQVSRLAYLNAMRPDLLAGAAEQGVQVYVTGQLRPGALPRARDLGLGVVALGHRRTEQWGLRQLARELERAFPELTVQLCADARASRS